MWSASNQERFSGANQGVRVGLGGFSTSGTRIRENVISDNTVGVAGQAGCFPFDPLPGLEVEENDISGGANPLFFWNLTHSSIEENTVTDAGIAGIVLIRDSHHNVVSENTVSGSGVRGIILVLGGDDNEITENTVTGSGFFGIALIIGASTGNLISENTVSGSGAFDMLHNAASSPNTWVDKCFDTSFGADIGLPVCGDDD